ncbi:hypothetical protein Cs7R123_15210 [Catellatospora sp. TT07R-123]|uniref:hypothetical protein n=1 Tax=Catellatospora sp. TT07R-123 TaxID=2733863 RepID=UPI001B24A22A|nr:hypothetical protein [Catellatospora sp. TT07R-123]GHJ44179.1 hypothetical protein Cs7R123_15210 [Catellatospora sp. TT07R-123]
MSILTVTAPAAGAALAVLLAVRARAFTPTGDPVEFDPAARAVAASATAADSLLRVIAAAPVARHQPQTPGPARSAASREALFLEVVGPPSRPGVIEVTGRDDHGFPVLAVRAAAPGKAIAAVLLHLRDVNGTVPRVDFAWPVAGHRRGLIRFLLLGSGHLAAVTVAVLRSAEPDPARRPRVHVGP